MATAYNHKLGDADYFKKYGNTPEAIASRLKATFENRGLTIDANRLARLTKEVRGGRTMDDIRKAIEPFAKSTSKNRQQRAEGSLDLNEIRDALKAISTGFNLQRGQLQGSARSVNDAAKRTLAELQRGEGRSIESFRSGAAGTGLLRSGLAVKDTGRIAENFANQRSAAESTRAEALRGIQNSLATLKSGETAARAAKAREMARAQVGTKEAIARALKLA